MRDGAARKQRAGEFLVSGSTGCQPVEVAAPTAGNEQSLFFVMRFAASCRELQASSLRYPDKSIVIPTVVGNPGGDTFKHSQRDPSVPQLRESDDGVCVTPDPENAFLSAKCVSRLLKVLR